MINTLRPGLPPLPPKMRSLRIDKRGYPVPFFVAMINGEPDHRVVEPLAMKACIEHRRCWICGGQLGTYLSFVVGPMCAVNRVSGEPPSHIECARYAAQACPFMARPHAKRREAGLPEEGLKQSAALLTRNPGVALIWTTRKCRPFRAPDGGVLFDMGPADSMEWFAEGRPATREEVEYSIRTGLPQLFQIAEEDGDKEGMLELKRRTVDLLIQLDRQFVDTVDVVLP